jgi:hypothetical protein
MPAQPYVMRPSVVHGAVHRRVLAHGRDDNAVRELELAQAQGHEQRLRRAAVAAPRGALAVRPPLGHALDERGVAQREVVVGDALRARHEVERELQRRLPDVAGGVLEPLEARLGRLLRLQHLDVARVLVGRQHARDVARAVRAERIEERDGVFHRELRARADREVRGVRGVAEQHHVAVVPALAAHGGKRAPDRAVGQELVAREVVCEQLRHERDRVLLRGVGEACPPPGVLRALDDPRRARLRATLERVGVHLEHAVLGLGEDESERGERLVRAEPGELAAPPIEARTKGLRVAFAERAAQAVAGHDQVRVRQVVGVDLGLEHERHAQLGAPPVEDLQELLARQPAEPVPGRAHARAALVGLDVRPVGEVLLDRGVALRVRDLKAAERLVREDDAPAEGVVRAVALVDGDLGVREALLEQEREVQPSGPSADARDLHAAQDNAPQRGLRRDFQPRGHSARSRDVRSWLRPDRGRPKPELDPWRSPLMKRFLPIVLALGAPAFVACTNTDTQPDSSTYEVADATEFDIAIEGMT